MSTTMNRLPIAEPRMQAPGIATPALETWMGVAIAAHRFEHPVVPISPLPSAPALERLPAGVANVPAWPAFRPAARPKLARYLSFGDREHLLRYARARADIRS